MKNCYAILFLDVKNLRIVRASIASEFPVTQAGDLANVHQVKLWTTRGRDYAAAERAMAGVLRRSDRAWFLGVLARTERKDR